MAIEISDCLGERDLGDHGIISSRMTARCLSKVARSEPAVELDLPGFSSARLDWLYATDPCILPIVSSFEQSRR
jgi:hypothetical protein